MVGPIVHSDLSLQLETLPGVMAAEEISYYSTSFLHKAIAIPTVLESSSKHPSNQSYFRKGKIS
jgi:hypothetical protein